MTCGADEVTVAQRIRIAELEQQLHDARVLLRRGQDELATADRGIREALAGVLPETSLVIVARILACVKVPLARADEELAPKVTDDPAEPLPDNVRPLCKAAFLIKRSSAHPVRDLIDIGRTYDSETAPCRADAPDQTDR